MVSFAAMSPAETTARPVGVTIIAIFLMVLSGLPIAFTVLAFLIDLVRYGPGVLFNTPIALFYFFVMALPGLLGWGLWNMQNSARVSCLIVLAICAASGILLVTHFGIVSFMALLYFGYLLWGGAIAVYLTRPSVKRDFQPEIEIINFKDL